MTTVHDVAARIVNHFPNGITTMKLQKLAYYTLGWGYALLKQPIFDERFLAWRNGPVCYELFDLHRGQYTIRDWPEGDELNLEPEHKIVIDAVLRNFGALSGVQLSEMSHDPDGPWQRIRRENNVRAGSTYSGEIPDQYIQEHFTIP